MRITKSIAVVISTALLLQAPANAVQLSTTDSLQVAGLAVADAVFQAPDPQAAYASLTEFEKKAFGYVEQPDVAEFRQVIGAPRFVTLAAFSGCWSMSGTWTEYSLAGLALFNWWQTTKVCASNGQVTSVTVNNYGEQATGIGWSMRAPAATATARYATEGRGLVRAYFQLGVNGWNIQEASPCGQIRMSGNGSAHSSSTSCNLS